ncbi:translocation/assembly module TamB [Buchnera aphidicola (Brachycaudus cardui)]|uniref:Translocation/assembly module TamB n=1 Tax=Buchnera aphidicola (Brachycaudus cardui) TaxID=557993 RepID=A0A4D6XRT5_9GAMM|nr:translocation/assembly module TamB [Buchnera aphidicola]QCI20242.1 translocation/assembly module TamB [Buchnera aphidicola (Brachycaudus cardui)]
MSIYQRYLSKSLIIFSSICIILLLCIESNIGFKWIFNLTSQFFLGLKVEKVSGNWRDFTLKNIHYDNFKMSIKADSIHVILDLQSLFKISTVCKELETKNIIIVLKDQTLLYPYEKKVSSKIIQHNILIKYPIIFEKIHADKILLKTTDRNVFLSNFSSGVKFINHTITFFPTYIDNIHVVPSNIELKKKFKKNTLEIIKSIDNTTKTNSFLYCLSTQSNIFIPFNIDIKFLKLNNLNLSSNTFNTLLSIELKAQFNHNILNIKRVKINSNLFRIESYGKVFFNNNSIVCNIKNKILLPNIYNKIINVSFKSRLNNKFIFQLKFHNLYNIHINGAVVLQNFNHLFYIHFKSNNLFFSIKKNVTLQLKNFNLILTGKKNNYSLSLKNILTIQGMPSIFIDIDGYGNLKNIFLKKINFFLIKKIIPLKNIIKYHESIFQLMGKINLSGKSNNSIYNICASKIHLDANMIEKKLSILGSLCYNKFNFLEIPGINILAGTNKLYLNGFLGKKFNLYSSIYADDLNYFLPNLKGKIKSKLNLYGNYRLPIITNKILASNLNWNNIYLKKMKILSNINKNNLLSGKVLVDMKQLRLYKLYIDSLNMTANWNNKKQNFCFLLKSPTVYVNIILNSIFNHKTGHWYSFFKKINIKTWLGEFIIQKSPFFYYYNKNNNHIKKNKIKNSFLYFLYDTKKSIFNILNQHHVNFKSELSLEAKANWISGKNFFSNAKISLESKNIRLEKKTKEALFYEDINNLKVFLNLKDNDITSKWIIKKYITSLEKNISGYFNVLDIYNKKNIQGNFIISNFPISFINFFSTNFKQVQGVFNSNISFFGTLYRPKASADVSLKNIFIKSDNILQYITLFFPYFLGKTDHIKINQEITIKKANILFTLNTFLNDYNPEWRLSFYSKNILVEILPKITVKFSSQLYLHYLFEKYDLIGYIKCSLFYLRINEKNFIF